MNAVFGDELFQCSEGLLSDCFSVPSLVLLSFWLYVPLMYSTCSKVFFDHLFCCLCNVNNINKVYDDVPASNLRCAGVRNYRAVFLEGLNLSETLSGQAKQIFSNGVSKKNPRCYWFCSALFYYWSRKLVPPLSLPIRSKSKANHNLFIRVF